MFVRESSACIVNPNDEVKSAGSRADLDSVSAGNRNRVTNICASRQQQPHRSGVKHTRHHKRLNLPYAFSEREIALANHVGRI
jgi:hypothetical protein